MTENATGNTWGLRDPGLTMTGDGPNEVHEFTGMWPLKPETDLALMASKFTEDWFLPTTAKLGLIRTARWFVARVSDFDGYALFFISQFDGDLQKYFDDFVYNGRDNLLKVWGQCQGCPDGPEDTARDIVRFIAAGQIRTLAIYDGFPEVSYTQVSRLADWYRKAQDFQRAVSKADAPLQETVDAYLAALAEPAPFLANAASIDTAAGTGNWQYEDVADRLPKG
ncbi:hypothetical protein KOI35_10280 [Actinoplanes bogorensis]|uniref:Uncharacterized protein n=1 Tax=Paractinoplanes bogorensis TaxID=1610840 RepID=A0ABS5YK77_9ACTN|nr:hypothetical protein [Actinoplanes bogorensis]MBU2663875.1 hypothetical protein [Actinoplanes bogorensis]